MAYKAVSADEVWAKLPKHVRESGERRGRELIAAYRQSEASDVDRPAKDTTTSRSRKRGG